MSNLTPEQQAVLQQAKARTQLTPEQRQAIQNAQRRSVGQRVAENGGNRLRAIGQGLGFGLTDEAEARARALAGEDYTQALSGIREDMQNYREQNPLESLGLEMAGAVGSAVALPATRGMRTLGGLAQRAGLEGALQGFGQGEGGPLARAASAGVGAVAGAGLGVGAGAIGRSLGALGQGVVNYGRQRFGRAAETPIAAELDRLVESSGMTADEIVQNISRGVVMGENETLRKAVRGYYAKQGPEASAVIGEAMQRRPAQQRAIANQSVQGGLGGDTPETLTEWAFKRNELSDRPRGILNLQKSLDEYQRDLTRKAYEPLRNIDADPEIAALAADAAKRVPASVKELNEAVRASGFGGKFVSFTKADDGTPEVVFARQPTAADIELIRRTIANVADDRYTARQGAAGEAIKGVEQELREAIDSAYPDAVSARRAHQINMERKDAFDLGRRALRDEGAQVEMDFEAVSEMGPEAIASYRIGFLQAYRAKMQTGSSATMLRNLTDPERKEAQAFAMVFPQDMQAGALEALKSASSATDTANFVLRGSATSLTDGAASQVGKGAASLYEIESAARGNPVAALGLVGRVIDSLRPGLDDAQKGEVARVLVSEDPEFVARALIGSETAQAVAERVNRALDQKLPQVSTAASRPVAGHAGASASE